MSYRFRQAAARVQSPPQGEPFHVVAGNNAGSNWLEAHRLGQGRYLLRFPGLADFLIGRGAHHLTCVPAPGAPSAILDHLHRAHVRPLALSCAGQLVLHAGAVCLDDCAVAYVGKSGAGKSTLTASFAAAGTPFLTDDSVVLELRTDGIWAHPGHEVMRLWADSAAAVPGLARVEPGPAYSRKSDVSGAPYCAEPKRLGAVLSLTGEGGDPEITLGSPASAFVELMRNAYVLDTQDRELHAKHASAASAVAQAVRFGWLSYRRDYGCLPAARALVTDFASDSRP